MGISEYGCAWMCNESSRCCCKRSVAVLWTKENKCKFQCNRSEILCDTGLDNEHNWTSKAIRCANKLQMRESDRQSPCKIQATMSQCKMKRRSLCMQEAWSKFSTDAGKHVMSETLALHVGDEAILHRYARKARAQHASY